MQTLSLVGLPIIARKEPGEHALCIVHMGAFIVVLKLPAGQSLQTLSVVEVPAADRYWPATHEVYGVQLGALVAVLKPVVHAAQVRSLLGVPWTMTYVPSASRSRSMGLSKSPVSMKELAP